MNKNKDYRFGKKCRRFLSKGLKNKKVKLDNFDKKKEVSVKYDQILEENANEQENIATTPVSNGPLFNNIEVASNTDGQEYVVKGGRIVDIQFLFNTIANIKHRPFGCTFSDLRLTKELVKGFYSEFFFTCTVCNVQEVIQTEPTVNAIMPINFAIISSNVNTGQGYSQLQQFSAVLNMPCMSNPLYQKLHEKVQKHLQDVSWEATTEAAKEEAKLAIEKGEVNEEGVPMITVVADGAWSKRSYRSNYNALSGVGCIVGYRTKKVLFMGVRNKYCSVCQKADVLQKVPSNHNCYKNWSSTSTAMEANIIVEGFMQSLKTQNLIYNNLIGDGDSSVMKKLQMAKPYGNKVIVKKIECTNHILRNYSQRLRDMSTKRKSSLNIVVPGYIRTKIKENLLRIRYAVTKAISFRQNMTLSRNEKVKLLKVDVTNGPYHVFGFHDKCDRYFCKRQNNDAEINFVREMKKCGLWSDIMAAINLVAYHSDSLIYHVNNNEVELYNSIVAKYIGGKRINFSFRGSYEARCHAAVNSYNYGPEHIRKFHKKVTNNSPGEYTKKYILKGLKSKQQKNLRKSFHVHTEHLVKKKLIAGPDEDYGAVREMLGCKPLQLSHEEFEEQKLEFLSQLKLSRNDIVKLERQTIGQSLCDVWKKARSCRLTASNFGKVCKLRKTTNRKNIVISILYESQYFHGTAATRYGIQFEPVAIEVFELVYKCTVMPAGLFVDSELPFLAASPDGLVGDDSIIEVKCPFSVKEYTPEKAYEEKKLLYMETKDKKLFLKRNHVYYFQIQGQLHITQKSTCYFVVWTPRGMCVDTIKRDDLFWQNKMEMPLTEFYLDHMVPEIISPQFNTEI